MDLSEYKFRNKMTWKQMADHFDIELRTIQTYTGKSIPSPEAMLKIAIKSNKQITPIDFYPEIKAIMEEKNE